MPRQGQQIKQSHADAEAATFKSVALRWHAKRSAWVIVAALCFHAVAALLCLREPRFFDLWLVRVSRCPRVRNHAKIRLGK